MAIKFIWGSFLAVVLLYCLADAKTIVPSDPSKQNRHNQNTQSSFNPQVTGQTQTGHDEGFHSCEVPMNDMVMCGSDGVTKQECEHMNCCYGARGCYFGKAGEYNNRASTLPSYLCLMRNVSNWNLLCDLLSSATLHCTNAGFIILVVAKDATVPSIDPDSISLLGDDSGNCSPHVSSAFIVYQFNPNECGTEVHVRIAIYVSLCCPLVLIMFH